MRYEWVCENCTEILEDDVPVDDRDNEMLCPSCGQKMRRGIGNKGGFRLKGSCWERDGYSTHVGDDKRWREDSSGFQNVKVDEV